MDLLTHDKPVENEARPPKITPVYAWLELTDCCNLKCVHCYGDFGFCQSVSRSLGKEDWKNVIDKISEHKEIGVQFIGGEPLAYSYFEELLIYAHEKGIKRIDIFTNATLFNDKLIDTVKKCNASVRVSLYGHNAETHDSITGKTGSFDLLVSNVKKLVEKNISVNTAVIIMRENDSCLDDIIKFIHSIGIAYNGYDVIRNTAHGKKNLHYVSNVDLLRPRYQCQPFFKTSRQEFVKHHFYNSCWSGKFAITANGDVIPCIFSRNHVCGNILKDDESIIYHSLEKYWKTTKDDVETCKDCEYRYACHDCRPTAEGLTGNYLSKHARCTYDPYTGEWKNISDYTSEILKE